MITDLIPTKSRKRFWLQESPVSYIGKAVTWKRSQFLADKIDELRREETYELYGVELNPSAIELMEQLYEDTFMQANITIADVNDVELPEVDLTFTMAVLEHIKDLSFLKRLKTKYFITMEDERGKRRWWYFKRNYKEVFEKLGYRQIEEQNLEGIIDGNFTYRLFVK